MSKVIEKRVSGMIRCLLALCCSVIIFGVNDLMAQTGSYQVSGVTIQGTQRIDSQAILQQLKAKAGTVNSAAVSDDVKLLYNTGFFDQVSAGIVNTTDGRTLLRYTVVEKPVVRKIFIKGNKEVKEDALADVIKLDSNRFLDRAKIDHLIRMGVAYYQSQGFYDAALDYSVTPVGDSEVDLTFVVSEGEKFRVRTVSIHGLAQLDEDDVLKELQVKRYKWWNSWLFGTGRVNSDMLEADKQIIRQYLLDHGFIDGTVAEASVEKRDQSLYVSFDVNEGPQYKIGKITASGDLIDKSANETLDGIESASGEVFSASTVRSDIFKISDKFGDKGYAFANVVPNTGVKRSEAIVDLDFNVNKGALVKVNRITITGNEKTYDHVIRRELKVNEQDTYSTSKIKRSQTLLERLGYFEEVAITNQSTNDPNKVDLNVNVKEGATGSFSVGAGYSTSDGALFNTKVSENNLFGTGRRLNLNADFGTERNNQIISFDDPRVNDSHLALGVDLLRTDRQYTDFDRELVGGALNLGYPAEEIFGDWAEDISFGLKHELSRINIKDIADDAATLVKQSEGRSTASSLTPSITRNTINNPLNPTRGSKQVLSYEFAGLGGDEEYTLIEARNTWYYTLIQGTYGEIVLSDRTQFGYGESRNDDPFPLFRRYFPGGINSVRGFKTRTLGPKDENGNEYGGAKQLVNNLELLFPLINSAGIRGLFFYDVGNAFDDNQSVDFGELRQSAGFGVRWSSPLGPIRLEFGHPLDREEGERNWVTMFSFGAPL